MEFLFIYNFALRKFDFRGWWSATPKNRGWSKKTQVWTGLKNGGGSLAVGTYLQRGSAPPPPTPLNHNLGIMKDLKLSFWDGSVWSDPLVISIRTTYMKALCIRDDLCILDGISIYHGL